MLIPVLGKVDAVWLVGVHGLPDVEPQLRTPGMVSSSRQAWAVMRHISGGMCPAW